MAALMACSDATGAAMMLWLTFGPATGPLWMRAVATVLGVVLCALRERELWRLVREFHSRGILRLLGRE